ncbi:unnamed protein product [Caenorhabditis angaria]|uniref:DNA polymerase V n=1 Tax=Caenorhabditis angaria TaxID=860376 RepID=A0A9P1IIZ5_9PELO|nr:unnamed protein product [Caenorhabditis angaria]
MRPPTQILDAFSKLAELNQNDRKDALKAISEQKEALSDSEVNKYCVERLITGLASTRAAARVGFSTGLLMLLTSEAGESWTYSKLVEIANKKMDLSDKTIASSHAVGHYLFLAAIVHSSKYKDDEITKIVEHAKRIWEISPSLTFSLYKLLADFSLLLKDKDFVKFASSSIEPLLESTNTVYTPENITLSLLLRKKYSAFVSKNVKFVKKDGSVDFPTDSYSKLLFAIKKCDPSNTNLFIDLLLETANFETLYTSVIEPWALASNETKVLDRIFGVVRQYFDKHNGNVKMIVVVFTKEVLNRMEMAIRGKGQFRLLRNSVQTFANYIKGKLENLKGQEAYDLLKELEKRGSVDKACGVALTTLLLGKLQKKQVVTWINENISNQDELRKIVSAFSLWDEPSRVAILNSLLSQTATDTTQRVVTSIIDSLFYVKTRAGDFASIQLSEHNEKILRQLVVTVGGEEIVKKSEKIFAKAKLREKSLFILWLVIRLWAAVSPNKEDASSYESDLEELIEIAKNEKDENNSQVFVDLLIGILSREKKFHRTPVAFAFAHSLNTLKSKDLIHIVETAMMSENELIDNEEDEEIDEEGMPFENEDNENEEDEDDDDEEEEEDDEENDETIDEELLAKLNSALGDAAAKEDGSDQEMDDLDDEEMQKMDERLAAAFKMMAPKKLTRKQSTKNVEALKMKIADILLIAISSQSVTHKNKLNLIIPLLKWAKTDLKQHDRVAQKAIELINIILNIKMNDINEKDLITLLKDIIEESQNVTNPSIVEVFSSIISFVLETSASESHISSGIKSEFLALFQNFFKSVEGKIPADFVIKPITKLPKLFVDELNMLINAGFDEQNRIFKRTEVLNATSVICTKEVLADAKIEKTVVKNLVQKASIYLKNVLEGDSSEIKPRFFATVLRVVLNLSASIEENEKLVKIMRDSLESIIVEISSGENLAKLKKMNSACQQIVGKSFPSVVKSIKKHLEISTEN